MAVISKVLAEIELKIVAALWMDSVKVLFVAGNSCTSRMRYHLLHVVFLKNMTDSLFCIKHKVSGVIYG